MQELEKILEEIRKAFEENTRSIADEDGVHHFVIDGFTATYLVNKIIRNHMNDGWIPVEDERLWDILFEEACVEGEQARRIYNRLKKTFDGERSEMNGKL